jgi:small subunit ribosomal protein S6
LNDYEMVVLYHPDLEIDLDKALKKTEKIVADNGGTITKMDNWGKRKLAYPINNEDHALYVYYEVQFPPTNVAKVESTMNITDEVLRYLIVKPTPRPEGEEAVTAPPEVDDESAETEATKEEEE